MKYESEPLLICFSRSNLLAVHKAHIAAKELPTLITAAIASTDLRTVLIGVMDCSHRENVHLRIDSQTYQSLHTIAKERRCCVNLLVNAALAKYLDAPSDDQGIVHEEIFLDPRTYERLKAVARTRNVTVDLLLNSALAMRSRPKRTPGLAKTRRSTVRRHKST